MAKETRQRAWESTKAVTLVGGQSGQTERRQGLQALIGELSTLPLPVEAIYKIGDAIECAWQIGRNENNTRN